jgi:hypothetical protein
MNNPMVKMILMLLSLAVVAGCATPDTNTNITERRALTDPTRVVLLFTRPVQPFFELGAVSTLKVQPQSRQSWQTVLREQAGRMGADAVIIDTSTLNNSNTPMVTGTAIQYQREKS